MVLGFILSTANEPIVQSLHIFRNLSVSAGGHNFEFYHTVLHLHGDVSFQYQSVGRRSM